MTSAPPTTTTTSTSTTLPPTVTSTTTLSTATTTPMTTTPTTTTPIATTSTKAKLIRVQNTTITDLTTNETVAEKTTLSMLSTAANNTDVDMNTLYLTLAIVLSVLVCIVIILVVCFVTYRRGRKKKAEAAAHLAADSKITPKTKRVQDLKNTNELRWSAISDNQSQNAAAPNGQSDTRARPNSQTPSTNRTSTEVTIDNETPRSSRADKPSTSGAVGNGVAISEPEYVNLAVPQAAPIANDDATYVEVSPAKSQSDPTSPNFNQSDSNLKPNNQPRSRIGSTVSQSRSRIGSTISQSQPVSQDPNQSLYENLQTSELQVNVEVHKEPGAAEAIYQNTMQGENLYEEAIRKEETDIYVVMK